MKVRSLSAKTTFLLFAAWGRYVFITALNYFVTLFVLRNNLHNHEFRAADLGSIARHLLFSFIYVIYFFITINSSCARLIFPLFDSIFWVSRVILHMILLNEHHSPSKFFYLRALLCFIFNNSLNLFFCLVVDVFDNHVLYIVENLHYIKLCTWILNYYTRVSQYN